MIYCPQQTYNEKTKQTKKTKPKTSKRTQSLSITSVDWV